ncbi:hypothetical protein JCGZ_18320 [Jatropha curcas]|uniref:Uncharacterized protein n=1 Tax=Jatropha curcas TaxID=180498 RepID=A0A067KC37_JATCU|nr:protein NIM1-INTERACTING 2 [Jatropha curcas]KDP29399.1 hypothetical protein JCGZ_18320 [Jatropha curcas]
MEAEKRKREDDGERKRSKGKRALNQRETAATEEEVEEFFAILRRIRVAVKYFEKNDGKRWEPSFEKEDFEEVNGDIEPKRKEEDCVDENTGLDLNSDPPSEDNSL